MKNRSGVTLEVRLITNKGEEIWLPSAKRKNQPIIEWEGKEYQISKTVIRNDEEEYIIKHYEL